MPPTKSGYRLTKRVLLSALLLLLTASVSPARAVSVTSKVCSAKLLRLMGQYCNDCVEFWPQNQTNADDEGPNEADNTEDRIRSDATSQDLITQLLAKINKMDRSTTPDPPPHLGPSANLEDLVVGCCMHAQCRLNDMTRFCCA